MIRRNSPHNTELCVCISSFRFRFSVAYLRSAPKAWHNAVLSLSPPSILDYFLKNMISLWYFLLKSTSLVFSSVTNWFQRSSHLLIPLLLKTDYRFSPQAMYFTWEWWFLLAFPLWSSGLQTSLHLFDLCQTGSIPSYFSFRCLLVSSDIELALLFLILQIIYGWFLKTEAGKDLNFLCHVNTWIPSKDNFALILLGI